MSKLAGLLLAVLAVLLCATVASADAAIIVGTSGVRPQDDQNAAGAAEAFRTTASATGNVASLSVYVAASTTATKLTVGLYANANGHPGALLTSGSKTGLTSGAVNDVPVSSAAVTSGTTYWIALLGTGGTLRFRDQANGGASESHTATGLTALPATWATGATYTDGNLSAYGSDGGTPVPPALNVTPTSLSFTATTGGSDPAAKTASVTNTGGGTLTYTTSTPAGAQWLAASPASGTAPATVTVSPHVSALAAGTYDANVTITAGAGATGSPKTIAVHLVVSDPTPPTLSVTPSSLSFTATTGGSDPAAKTASVTNTGAGTLTYTTSTPAGAPWLAASPASGTAPATVTVSPHVSALAAGTYDANVTITAGAGATGSPKTIAVHLVVSDPTPPPPPGPADWLQVDHDAERTGYASGETTLGPTQARTLGTAWSTAVDGKVTAQPLHVANVSVGGATRDVIVAATSAASLYALDADTGAVLWRRNYGTPPSNCAIPGGYGFVAPPAIDKARGRIYSVTEGGSLVTLNLADGTDAAPAQAIITGAATNRVWGGPTLLGSSTLYVSTASDGCDSPPWRGRIIKVDVSGATPSVSASWDVVPGIASPNGGGGIWGYGGVSADSATGRVYTATGADSVEAYTLYADRLVALSPNLSVLGSFEPFHPTNYPCTGDPCDADFGSTPVVFTPTGCPTMVSAGNKNGVLYVTKATTLAANGQAEQAIQLNPANDWLGSGGVGGVPAWDPADQMLFVTDVGDGVAGVAAGVVGLKVNPATCTLSVAWSRTLGGQTNPNSTPTVANGVVYAGEGYSGKLAAFDAKTGEALWASAGPGAAFAAPIVADGMVYQGVWNGFTTAAQGTIRAFKPGATPPPPPPTTLLGTTSIGSQADQNVAGSAEAFQATATASGSLGRLSVYLDSGSASTKVAVGIYADNAAGTHPGALLTQASTTTLTAGAWNTVTVPAAAIASGTRYWVAVLGTGGTLRFRDGPNGCKSEASASSALTALPATWTTGATYTDCPLSAYGTTAPGA
jgi:outer membrane protein assembly factor BamB